MLCQFQFESVKTLQLQATAKTGELKVNSREHTGVKAVRIFLNLADNNIFRRESLLETSIRICARMAAELLTKELNSMGVLEQQRRAAGAGTRKPDVQHTGDYVVDLGGARTQSEAYEAITKMLLAQGKTVGSKEFDEGMRKAWVENKVKDLPER